MFQIVGIYSVSGIMSQFFSQRFFNQKGGQKKCRRRNNSSAAEFTKPSPYPNEDYLDTAFERGIIEIKSGVFHPLILSRDDIIRQISLAVFVCGRVVLLR